MKIAITCMIFMLMDFNIFTQGTSTQGISTVDEGGKAEKTEYAKSYL